MRLFFGGRVDIHTYHHPYHPPPPTQKQKEKKYAFAMNGSDRPTLFWW